MAISGKMVVGQPTNDNGNGTNHGAVYVFTPQVETWVEDKKLTGSDGSSTYFFGWSVAISIDTLLVGGYGKGYYRGGCL